MCEFVIENINDFDLDQTFLSGQCFMWQKQPDGSYIGSVNNCIVNIKKEDGNLIIKSSSNIDKDRLIKYFDLDRDYEDIRRRLSKDNILTEAISFGTGQKMLRQEHWECLISFIISANNMVPKIFRSVNMLSNRFGDAVNFDGDIYYTFPSAEVLDCLSEEDIKSCGVGFRAKYIKRAANMVASKEINLAAIEAMPTDVARMELVKIPGVGQKVADCVLLYAYGRYEVFPIDVWIKRIIEYLYIKEETTFNVISEFAFKNYGELAGFAQQYFFYYARVNKIGKTGGKVAC